MKDFMKYFLQLKCVMFSGIELLFQNLGNGGKKDYKFDISLDYIVRQCFKKYMFFECLDIELFIIQ